MTTRKEMLYKAGGSKTPNGVIPATVSFRHNRRKGLIEPLSAKEKMLCALRKVLTAMSDRGDGRYYIANNKVELTKAPTTTAGKEGEPQSYHATGRCKVGICNENDTVSFAFIEFGISYRDVKDDRGLADVEYFDPTTIDRLPKNTPIDLSALA